MVSTCCSILYNFLYFIKNLKKKSKFHMRFIFMSRFFFEIFHLVDFLCLYFYCGLPLRQLFSKDAGSGSGHDGALCLYPFLILFSLSFFLSFSLSAIIFSFISWRVSNDPVCWWEIIECNYCDITDMKERFVWEISSWMKSYFEGFRFFCML